MASGGTRPAGFVFQKATKATDEPSVALSYIETPPADKKTTPASRAGVVNNLKDGSAVLPAYL